MQSGEDDLFLVFTVSASRGRNARIFSDSVADEHDCPTDFASATPLKPTNVAPCDAQEHTIEAHGTRTVLCT